MGAVEGRRGYAVFVPARRHFFLPEFPGIRAVLARMETRIDSLLATVGPGRRIMSTIDFSQTVRASCLIIWSTGNASAGACPSAITSRQPATSGCARCPATASWRPRRTKWTGFGWSVRGPGEGPSRLRDLPARGGLDRHCDPSAVRRGKKWPARPACGGRFGPMRSSGDSLRPGGLIGTGD